MDHLTFSFTPIPKGQKDTEPETLRLTKNGIKGCLTNFTGTQGEHFVSIIPSLNVSGYGATHDEAIESLKENLNTLFFDLFALTEVQRRREINKMGWMINRIFKKQFSTTYVDENGVLQNFDNPEKVLKSMLQAA